MDSLLKRIILGKFGRDVAWNAVSLVTLFLCGIALNILIARVYGAATLGVFNQVYAVYILLSQFASFGIHFSVLKYVSQFKQDRHLCNKIVSSALVLTALAGAAVALLTFALRGEVAELLKSPDVSIGLLYASPGLLFFALNKVLLALLNSHRRMKAYALASALRYILMLGLLIGIVLLKLNSAVLPLIFTVSEVILLFGLFFYTLRLYSFVWASQWTGWAKTHILFGLKAFISGALGEVNTRVDILMLGFFTTDRLVGIYSLAAMLVEGLVQLTVAVRANVNPIISQLFFQKGPEELAKMVRWGIKKFYWVMGGIGILAVMLYPVLIYLFLNKAGFMLSWPLFAILTAGVVLSAGYLPFNMLLNQAGYPGWHTLLVGLKVIVNIIFNAMLIPLIGVYGAAVATALSFVLAVLFFKVFVRKTLAINL